MNRSISESGEAAGVLRKKAEASPQRADFEREFGAASVKDNADGSWTCTLRDKDQARRAFDMQAGIRKIDVERGEQRRAKHDGKRERVARQDGRIIEMREDLIDNVKHKVRPVGRYSTAPSVRFGLSESFGKYEQGPQGLWFVWNGGWEPTSLFGGAALEGEQHDPDGNVWLKVQDEWVLESEVA